MLKFLQYIAAIFTSVVTAGKYLIKRREQAWAWFKQWRKGRREDAVDKAIISRNGKRVGNIMRDILKKRNKRHKTS